MHRECRESQGAARLGGARDPACDADVASEPPCCGRSRSLNTSSGGLPPEPDASRVRHLAPRHTGQTPERPWRITRLLRRAGGLWTNEVHYVNTGTVKWFNETKGYGFIQPDDGGKDVFVHISAVERSGLMGLREGQKVAYELQTDQRNGKQSAVNLQAA